jgi:hypothetical protein
VLEALEEINFGQEELTAKLMTGQKEISAVVNYIPSAEEMRSKEQGLVSRRDWRKTRPS